MGIGVYFRQVIGLVLVFFLSCGVSDGLAGSKMPLAPTPGWVQPIALKTETKIKPDETSGGYHYLLRNSQYNLPGKSFFSHRAFKVFSEEGVQPVSEISVDFDPNYEKLAFHILRIWRNGKAIDKTNARYKIIQQEKDREKHIYNEQQSAIIILDDVRINDVVEYSYSIQGWNPVFGDTFFNSFYLENYDPIDELFIRIVTSPQRPLFIKLENTSLQPLIATASNQRTYTWHLKDIPGKAMDSDVPSWYDPFAWAQVSEFKSWAEVVDWALPLYEIKTPLSEELLQETARIKKKYGSQDDRITAAVRFVQDEIRYLGFENGISGYKPFAPSRIFKQRFGDCKDKSLLLVAMLRELEVEAYPALVNTTYKDQVQHWLPSVYAFNHCIVSIAYMGRQFWIDPTISLQRGSFDSIATPAYKAALLIKKNNRGFTRMQVPQHSKTKITESFHFKDVGGPVSLDVKTEYFGMDADFQRSRFASTTTRQTEKDYLNFYAKLYPDIAVDRKLVFVDDAQNNKFTTFEEYTIRDMWTVSEQDSQALTAEFYPQILRDHLLMPNTRIRKMPIGLSHPEDIEQTIQLFLPKAWPVNAQTKTIKDKTFFYQSDISYQPASHCLTLIYRYKNLQDFVPVSGATAYIKNQKEILNDLGFTLYNNQELEASVSSFALNGMMVLVALVALGLAGFGAYKLYFYNPPVLTYEPENYPIGGWLALVALGLCLSPVRTLVLGFNANYFNLNLFKALVDPASMAYNPGLALTLVVELVFIIGFLVYSLLLIKLFFERRTSLPRLISIYYLSSLAFGFLDGITVEYVNGKPITWMYPSVVGLLVTCLIWVPYFHSSIRVKETFCRRLPDPEDKQPVPSLEKPLEAEGLQPH